MLKPVAEGNVILHDEEFSTVMGMSVSDFKDNVQLWPEINGSDGDVLVAVKNALNHLLGYPHGFHEKWDTIVDVRLSGISDVYKKWRRGKPTSVMEL